MKKLNFLILVITFMVSTESLAFDCKKAFLPVDFVICSSTQVMEANEAHENAWYATRARLNKIQQKELLDSQREWLKQYPPTCGIPASGKAPSIISIDSQQCVINALKSRTDFLNNYSNSPNANPISTDIPNRVNLAPTSLPLAPFGLSWGESKLALENKGINLQASSNKGRISSYRTNHLPNDLSIAEQYTLIFDTEYNLQKIILISKDINSDLYGSKGKEIFADIKLKLAKKYGNPINGLEMVGRKLFNEQDEFYQCLAYEGCGDWVAIYLDEKQGSSVVLELKGLGRGKGYINITYEGPNWSNIVNALKQKESESDAKSL